MGNNIPKLGLSISDRRAALRTILRGMVPDGFRVEALTPKGRQERCVRDCGEGVRGLSANVPQS